MNLVIDRAKWLSGDARQHVQSVLHHRDTGLQCCLGQYLCALGVPVSVLAGRGMPASVVNELDEHALPEEAGWLLRPNISLSELYSEVTGDSQLGIQLQTANDSDASSEEREALIIAGFRQAGVNVTFTGSSLPAVKAAKAWRKADMEIGI